jgi:hypothetical protein
MPEWVGLPPVVRADGPRRIQLHRTKGFVMPLNCRSVARPSEYGNPFRILHDRYAYWVQFQYHGELGDTVGTFDRAGAQRFAVEAFRVWLPSHVTAGQLARLRGHDLGCFCPLVDENGEPVPCHAEIWLFLANKDES